MKKNLSVSASLRGFWGDAQKQTFLSAMLVGLATHIYKFTNTLYNGDSLWSQWTPNIMTSSGRWFLSTANMVSSFYDLPWLIGLLSLIYIALTAAVVADIFKVRRRSTAVLIGGLLAAFPCITATFFYEFTADGYMLAMLLAALSVRLNLVGDKNRLHIAAAAVLICLSSGIYQAYVSFALLLSMSHFILELVNEEREDKQLYRWIGKQFVVYGAGLALYYIIWKICLSFTPVPPTDYQGINEVGNMNAAALLAACKEMLRSIASFLLGGNIFKYGVSVYAVMNLLMLAGLAALLIYAFVQGRAYRRRGRVILFVLSLISLPFFTCIWLFVSPGVFYYPVMLQSLCVLYILPLLLSERFCGPKLKALTAVFFAALVFKFSVQANTAYFHLERSNRISQVTAAEMLTRIHLLDDGSVKKVAFLGNTSEFIISSDPERTGEIIVFANLIQENLFSGHSYATFYLTSILNSDYTPLTGDEVALLKASGQADDMPVWPQNGSVRVIGDTVVIKLSDW